MPEPFYLLSYAWRYLGESSWQFDNLATHERPAAWFLRVRRMAKEMAGNPIGPPAVEYRLLGAVEIAREEYEALVEVL